MFPDAFTRLFDARKVPLFLLGAVALAVPRNATRDMLKKWVGEELPQLGLISALAVTVLMGATVALGLWLGRPGAIRPPAPRRGLILLVSKNAAPHLARARPPRRPHLSDPGERGGQGRHPFRPRGNTPRDALRQRRPVPPEEPGEGLPTTKEVRERRPVHRSPLVLDPEREDERAGQRHPHPGHDARHRPGVAQHGLVRPVRLVGRQHVEEDPVPAQPGTRTTSPQRLPELLAMGHRGPADEQHPHRDPVPDPADLRARVRGGDHQRARRVRRLPSTVSPWAQPGLAGQPGRDCDCRHRTHGPPRA